MTPSCQTSRDAKDTELVSGFVLEAREYLVLIESRMLELERNPSHTTLVHEVFRNVHTIKGMAGFLGFSDIGDVAHHVESLLELARNAAVTITPAVVDAVLEDIDHLKKAIEDLESAGDTPRSVRVETSKLDRLMRMLREMASAEAMIHHNAGIATLDDPALTDTLSQLWRLTTEAQRTTVQMRMVPIGQLFTGTRRMIRDLSREAGKCVQLQTRGDDTEVDRAVAEELSHALVHIVRNAIDHGIERPEIRAAAGKNVTGRLRLGAYHRGAEIWIEVSDDGRGMDPEMFDLIFAAGFSTACEVTQISGRGVGMDVVRKHVVKLGGHIDVQSTIGRGTTFTIKLPFSS